MKNVLFFSLILIICISCKQTILKYQITHEFGSPIEDYIHDNTQIITYKYKNDDYFKISSGIKPFIDNKIDLLPSKSETYKIFSYKDESWLYDHYEWEKPQYKIIVENLYFSLEKGKENCTTKIYIETK